ncbi:MAG: serpin family protein, partial [Clostridia bacterium]|nr:serpin family protein [Clostridia bacterium]
MKKLWKGIALTAAVALSTISAVGCEQGNDWFPPSVNARELTSEVTCEAFTGGEISEGFKQAYYDFSSEFIKEAAKEGRNALVSPLSAAGCLGMIANGSAGKTLGGFEQFFGDDLTGLNEAFSAAMQRANDSPALKIADSIWTNAYKPLPKEEFLKAVKKYYASEIYYAVFDDKTKDDINNWTANKTNGMIKEILDDIDPTAITYLVNALYFESEWEIPFASTASMPFYGSNGRTTVNMMFSDENTYFEAGNAKCVVKRYKEEGYSFVGILPEEGKSINEFLSDFSLSDFLTAYSSAKPKAVKLGLPEFTYDYDIQMKDLLCEAGLSDAFDPSKADFSEMFDLSKTAGNVYLDFVLQKTKIEVTAKGTKAAAATIGGMKSDAISPYEENKVYFDRPFVYM